MFYSILYLRNKLRLRRTRTEIIHLTIKETNRNTAAADDLSVGYMEALQQLRRYKLVHGGKKSLSQG